MFHQKSLNLHLISDLTCVLNSNIANVIQTQFPNLKINKFYWPFIRNIIQVNEIVESIKNHNGIALFSILDEKIEEKVIQEISKIPNCKTISIMNHILKECGQYLDLPTKHISRQIVEFDDKYKTKMEAIQYTIDHDDGKNLQTVPNADIIIFGVSRTSKTPTSIYLSYNGYKVANVPFVKENLMPDVNLLKQKLIVGLIIDPDRLVTIRENRFKTDAVEIAQTYLNIDIIRNELFEFRKYCAKINIPILDVTRKSVEEISVLIVKMYNNFDK